MTPPIEPITGKDAFFIEDKFPYKIFFLNVGLAIKENILYGN